MRPILLLVMLMVCGATHAAALDTDTDLGVIGPVYEIKEKDLLQWIKNIILEMQRSGELEKLQREEEARARKRIERPEPVTGITLTTKPRVYHVAPTLIVDHGINDARGRVIAMPGTKVNPFDYMTLSKHLIFIDGDDPDQVKWAEAMYSRYDGKVKTILVAGAPLDLMKRWQRQVWFDQHGVLCKRFRLQHVPAIVSQEGKRLRVAEVLP